MRWFLAALLLSGPYLPACNGRSHSEPPPAPKPAAPGQLARHLARQPKPGERVRQPELDGYCDSMARGGERTDAYYYHGGSPVVRIAREDGCAPLYITECESEGRCYPPRDQEPGMWCCSNASAQQAAARTTR